MPADIQAFFDPATATVTYLVADPVTRRSAIIDPVLDYEPKAARLETRSIDNVLAVAARVVSPSTGRSIPTPMPTISPPPISCGAGQVQKSASAHASQKCKALSERCSTPRT